MYRKGMNNLEKEVDKVEELLYNARIKQLNGEYAIQIPELPEK